MEKITKADFYETVSRIKYREKHPLIKELDKLEIEDGLRVNKDDWNKASIFPTYVQQVFRQGRSEKKFTSHTLKDGSGWLILRIK